MMTKYTLRTSIPIPLNKVIFGKNDSSTKILRKDFILQWYLHLPNLRVIIDRDIRVNKYMEAIKNEPFPVRFQRNTSGICVN